MKNKFILTILFLTLNHILSAAPLAGVSGISANTERAATLAQILEQHLYSILKNNSFNTIEPDIINRELVKFNCTEEKCILKFAENADMDLIVSGKITDKKKYLIIKLEAYGINIPFNKRIVNRYQIKIPMDVSINSREFSLISEEHAAAFLSKTLETFLYQVKIKKDEEKYTLTDDLKFSGKFIIYTRDKNNSIKIKGETDISDGKLSLTKGEVTTDSFILIPFKDKSKEITRYYSTRKREIVFQKASFYDTLYVLAVTPIASASMPIAAPFLGYYMNNDWAGLSLWALNAPPYLYMEAKGFINSPDNLKEKKANISRDDRAMNYFAWYMLVSGGMPLFIDAYSSNYLHQAAYFTGNNELLGNPVTAAMLSLTSNGAGHFYRGDRYWGYFYFHLNNILLYMTLREFSAPENFDPVSQTYTKGSTNRNRGIALCSIFAISKTVEIVHAILGKENLISGEIIDDYVIPEPLFTVDQKGDPVFGIHVTMKF